MIDLILYFFCAFALLSFSFSLVDGYPLFAIIWLSSIFIACSSDCPSPALVRSVWAAFFLGMLLGRFLFARLLQPILSVHVSSPSGSIFQESIPEHVGTPKEIKKVVLIFIALLSFVGLLLEASGLGVASEQAGQLHAASKSPISYSLAGLSSTLYTYWIWSIIFLKSQIKISEYKIFVERYLVMPVIAQFIGSLKYLAYLSAYGLKLVSPVTSYLSYRLFYPLSWSVLTAQFLRKKLSLPLVISLAVVGLGISLGFFIYSSIGLGFQDLLLLKVLGRADGYIFFDDKNLRDLIAVYGGNFLYFFQPFLKVIGLKAYDMPMGSWLVSGGNNLAQIGGPNVHLPIVMYILSSGGAIGIFSVFFAGLICSVPLLYSRNKIVELINGSRPRPVFWPIFFFFNFILLLTEPSAFGHSLFFSSVTFFTLKFFAPTLFYVVKLTPPRL